MWNPWEMYSESENSKCKGPEAGKVVNSKNSKEDFLTIMHTGEFCKHMFDAIQEASP